jgi:DNA helicase-2/ATP-dependent DNA helicase PcrA
MITAAELSRELGLPAPTPEQSAVIEAPLVPGLVVAGAGSGKTETMASRVVYLVATGQVRPEQVLGLTFTRKAAAALGQRVRRRLRLLAASGIDTVDAHGLLGDPEVATYHSFGGRLIADFGPLAGVEPASAVLTPTGAWQLARRVVGRWDGDLRTDLGPDQVTERLLAISGALADHLSGAGDLENVLEELLVAIRSAPPTGRQRSAMHSALADHVKRLQDRQWIIPLTRAFAAAKRERGVIDFSDQMQIAATLVQEQPRVGAVLREKYAVVLLDWGLGFEPAAVRHRLPVVDRHVITHPLAADQLPEPACCARVGQRGVGVDPVGTVSPGAGRRASSGGRGAGR